ARDERRGRHASPRRPALGHARHLRHVLRLLPGDHRRSAVLRLLRQGHDHRRGVQQGRHLGRPPRHGGADRRRPHRVLHDPGDVQTFEGERRWDAGAHPHEVPPIMTSPMILLAIGAVGWGAFEILGARLAHFLGPVTGYVPPEPAIFSASGIGALALVAAGIALAWAMYGRRPVSAVAPAAGFAVTAARRDLYGDA